MSVAGYPEYKESGVEQLGAVPAHWVVTAMKRYATFIYGDALAAEIRRDGATPVFGSNGIVGEHDEANTLAPAIFIGRKGSCGALSWSDEAGFAIDTAYYVDTRSTNASLKWLYWALHVLGLSKLSQDTGVPGLSREIAHESLLAFPPLPEQTAIAGFLDRETGKIDALVEEQRRLIALLKEKRQAVISHAVTKGLDPNAPMKDSGVEWLGEVPTHWEVRRLRFIAKIETGDADTADAEEDGEYPFFVRSPTIERISRYTFDCEAVLTAGDGAGVGKIYHHFTGQFCAHQRVYVFSDFRDISGRFFYHYLVSSFHKVALEGGAKSTVDSLRRPLIANFWMTIPTQAEQASIIKAVDEMDEAFDRLVAQAESGIAFLQERRAALISAAVTGKIDVRHLVPSTATRKAA